MAAIQRLRIHQEAMRELSERVAAERAATQAELPPEPAAEQEDES